MSPAIVKRSCLRAAIRMTTLKRRRQVISIETLLISDDAVAAQQYTELAIESGDTAPRMSEAHNRRICNTLQSVMRLLRGQAVILHARCSLKPPATIALTASFGAEGWGELQNRRLF